jgi:hypothetical protein
VHAPKHKSHLPLQNESACMHDTVTASPSIPTSFLMSSPHAVHESYSMDLFGSTIPLSPSEIQSSNIEPVTIPSHLRASSIRNTECSSTAHHARISSRSRKRKRHDKKLHSSSPATCVGDVEVIVQKSSRDKQLRRSTNKVYEPRRVHFEDEIHMDRRQRMKHRERTDSNGSWSSMWSSYDTEATDIQSDICTEGVEEYNPEDYEIDIPSTADKDEDKAYPVISLQVGHTKDTLYPDVTSVQLLQSIGATDMSSFSDMLSEVQRGIHNAGIGLTPLNTPSLISAPRNTGASCAMVTPILADVLSQSAPWHVSTSSNFSQHTSFGSALLPNGQTYGGFPSKLATIHETPHFHNLYTYPSIQTPHISSIPPYCYTGSPASSNPFDYQPHEYNASDASVPQWCTVQPYHYGVDNSRIAASTLPLVWQQPRQW